MPVHDFIPLMTASVWPVTVLGLAFLFRGSLKARLTALSEARIGNNALIFGQAGTDRVAEGFPKSLPTPKQITAAETVKWQNVANLFWLGNDFQWMAQIALRGASRQEILHGLKQCSHHASELGLAEDDAGKRLAELKSQVDILPDSSLTAEWRASFAKQVYSVIERVSTLTKAKQGNFRP